MSTTTGIAVAATFVWLGMVLAVGAEVVEVAALAAGGALLLAGQGESAVGEQAWLSRGSVPGGG